MSRTRCFTSRFITITLILFAALALGVYCYRSQAQIFVPIQVTVVSAATFEETAIAPNSIAVAFSENPFVTTASATGTTLPTTLGGVTVRLKDSAGVNRDCGLFFVSPLQTNFLVPAETAPGLATIAISFQNDSSRTGTVEIAPVAPGLFSANANGQGAAIGFLLSVPQQGSQNYESLVQFDQQRKQFVTRPILLDRQTVQAERLFFVLYGTGIGSRNDLSAVSASIGGVRVPVSFAGAIPNFFGFDQVNIPIEASLIRQLTGRGRVNVALTISDQRIGAVTSNVVEIEIADRPGSNALIINGIEPARALAGDQVTIKGSGFLSTIGGNRVRIGSIEAQVTEATGEQLKIRVPFGAETGPVTVRAGQGEATSREPLTIRTSVSGFVEDTRRRPLIGVTVRAFPFNAPPPISQPIASSKTNSEGVFILPDLPGDEPVYIDIDASTASVTPRLPLLSMTSAVVAGRDNQLTRPITLQIPTGPGIKFNTPGVPLQFSLSVPAFFESFEHDWIGAIDANATAARTEPSQLQQQFCAVQPGSITFELPSNSLSFIPCDSIEECQETTRRLYVTQIENSRAPVRLPTGHFSSTMVQLTPYRSRFSPGGTLTMPNRDCLPAGSARVFKLQTNLFVLGGVNLRSAPVGQFFDAGSATISSDGQRITTAAGLIQDGGIYFVSIKRPLATITGRVLAPEAAGGEGSTALIPVRRAIVTARGQETMTDGNGSFILRNVPVLRNSDVLAVDISLLRPNGRVERALQTDITITPNGTVSIGDLPLAESTSNRPPVIIASASIAAEENKRTDFNFTASDADANQTLQVSMTGPSFASLINRGGGGYILRIAPGSGDAGDYSVTITATDSLGLRAIHVISLRIGDDAVNKPPTANPQSLMTDEDKRMPITLTGSDPNRDALRYSIVTQPAHGKLTGDAPDLTYIPDENYFGSDSFTFKVNDGLADSPTATVSITINSVNDTPRLTLLDEQKVAVGQELRFTVSASDVDMGDAVNFTADLPAGATLIPIAVTSGFAAQFSWTPTQGQVGPYVISFKATDNGNPPQSVTRPLAITVTEPGAPSTAAMWAPTSGPTGGAIGAVFASGSTLLASSPLGGVFRSTDGGENWSPVGVKVFSGLPVGAFASVGSTILASTGISIFRSTDNGVTWAAASVGLEGQFLVTSPLTASFAVKNSLVFTTIVNRVYVSSDNGSSFALANKGLPVRSSVTTLTTSGSSVFAGLDGGIFKDADGGVYRTDDDGKNWIATSQGLPLGGRVDRLVANAGTVYATLAINRIPQPATELYALPDKGQNWTKVGLPPEIASINSIVFTPDQWLISTPLKVFSLVRQTNGTISATTLFENQFISTLAASDTAVFAGTLLEGLFRSTDKGKNWKQTNSGLSAMSIHMLHSAGSNLFAATSAGVYTSDDQGKTWQAANNGFENVLNSSIVIFGGSGQFISPIDVTALTSVTASDKTYLFAAQTSSKLYRSLDLGKKWEPVEGLPELSSVSALGVNGSTVFASLFTFGLPSGDRITVYRSSDQGKSWTPASKGLPISPPTAFASTGMNIFAAVGDRVFVSSNNGDSWSEASNGLPEKIVLSTLSASGSNLYAGTFGKGIFVSPNNGQSWTAINSTLPQDAFVTALFAIGSNLFVVTPTEYDAPCPLGGVLIDGKCFGVLIPGLSPPGIRFGSLFGSRGGTLYFSPNLGKSWAPIISGLNDVPVTALGAIGMNIFAGTRGSGVFVRQF